MFKRDVYAPLVLVLIFFAFGMSALVSRAVFERLPHLEDEVAYLFQAKVFARGHIVVDTPTPATAFWEPFVVDQNGNRFSKYTPGWSMFLAFGILFGQAWVINAFFAALTVALVYRLGREIFNPETGLVAATLTAFSPMALLLNGTLMGHTAALFFAMLFIFAFWRLTRSKNWRWGLLAGVALGLLVINRPLTAVAVAAPFVVWSVVLLVEALFRKTAPALIPQPVYREGEESTPASLHTRLTSIEPSQTDTINRVPTEDSSVGTPFMASAASQRAGNFLTLLRPLIILGIVTVIIALAIPLYNYTAVGNPTKNLYTLVWEYDQVGFGPGYGKSGHTLEKGVQFARYDLTMTAADLFGWHLGSTNCVISSNFPSEIFECKELTQEKIAPMGRLNEEARVHLLNQSGYYIVVGVSWLLLFPGLLIGFKRDWAWLWVVAGVAWLLWSPSSATPEMHTWLKFGVVWVLAPLPFIIWKMRSDHQPVWTWLLLMVTVLLVTVQLGYWIGSQRYTTRYYYEMLGAVAILSALPVAWLMRRAPHPVLKAAIYGALLLISFIGLYNYSTPRIDSLYRFNRISQEVIQAVEARRQTDQPALVLVSGGDVRWRVRGSHMALMSPFFDSDIVVAWNNENVSGFREQILSQFPDREVIEMRALQNDLWFEGDCPDATCPPVNPPDDVPVED